MSAAPEASAPSPVDLDAAADQAMDACGGDAREAVKALLVANDFLEQQLDELRTKVSTGYARGRLPAARERKDEADGRSDLLRRFAVRPFRRRHRARRSHQRVQQS